MKRREKPGPTFEFEARELSICEGPVAGIDEAGRGPWAGPVVAAAVILEPEKIPVGLADSKVLSARRREILFDEILVQSDVGVGIADVDRIDRDNVLAATLWAMKTAVGNLGQQPSCALVDGNRAPDLDCRTRTIVKGDGRSVSIAAASIVAKVTRDRIMIELARVHPGYGFEQHKGYGTRQHREAISRLGVIGHHRRSFKPIRIALEAIKSHGLQ